MEVKYSIQAKYTISVIANFVDENNTIGAGERWSLHFRKEIAKYAQPIKYSLCRHEFWAKRKFHCLAIKNWIIIFKIEDDIFYVYRIFHSSTFR